MNDEKPKFLCGNFVVSFISFLYLCFITGKDLVDEIMAHMIDHRKTRRQVLRQLVHLDLIGSAKDLKVRRFVQRA